jgi:simple sugar transport system permease protein
MYTSAGYSLAGMGFELDVIAAVVIGGTLITGGVGLMAGTMVGVLIQGVIQTFIIFQGTLSSWWTRIFIGFLLFAFIMLQRYIAKLPVSQKTVEPVEAATVAATIADTHKVEQGERNGVSA